MARTCTHLAVACLTMLASACGDDSNPATDGSMGGDGIGGLDAPCALDNAAFAALSAARPSAPGRRLPQDMPAARGSARR